MPSFVLAQARAHMLAFPLRSTVAVLRRAETRPLCGVPACVVGLTTFRGRAAPVVDAARLLLGDPVDPWAAGDPGRVVVLDTDHGVVALLVDAVDGVASLSAEALAEAPPLLSRADEGLAATVRLRDQRLALVLDAARVLPADLRARLAAEA